MGPFQALSHWAWGEVRMQPPVPQPWLGLGWGGTLPPVRTWAGCWEQSREPGAWSSSHGRWHVVTETLRPGWSALLGKVLSPERVGTGIGGAGA